MHSSTLAVTLPSFSHVTLYGWVRGPHCGNLRSTCISCDCSVVVSFCILPLHTKAQHAFGGFCVALPPALPCTKRAVMTMSSQWCTKHCHKKLCWSTRRSIACCARNSLMIWQALVACTRSSRRSFCTLRATTGRRAKKTKLEIYVRV